MPAALLAAFTLLLLAPHSLAAPAQPTGTVSKAGAAESPLRVDSRSEVLVLPSSPIAGGSLGKSLPLIAIQDTVARNLGMVGLDLHVSAWGQVQGVDAPRTDRAAGDLAVGMLRYHKGALDLRLGRQPMLLSAGLFRSVDALSARLMLPGGFAVGAFGGMPAMSGFEGPGGWLAGATLGNSWLSWMRLEARYLHQVRDAGKTTNLVGGTLAAVIPGLGWTLDGGVSYGLEAADLVDASVLLGVPLTDSIRVLADYRRTNPGLILPTDSVLAVFSRLAMDRAGLAAAWRGSLAGRDLVIQAGGGADLDGGGEVYTGGNLRVLHALGRTGLGLATLAPGWARVPASWVVLDLVRRSGAAGGYSHANAALNLGFSERLSGGGHLQATMLDEAVNDSSLAAGGGLHMRWLPGPRDISVLASARVATRPGVGVGDGITTMIRLAWTPQMGGSALQAAPAKTAAPPSGDVIKFNHKLHSDEAECADCHGDVDKAGQGAALLPKVSACDECHDTDHPAIALANASTVSKYVIKDDDECGNCHTAPLKANASSFLARAQSGLIFSHARHAGKAKKGCVACHAGVANSTVASDRLQPDMATCRACHEPAFQRFDCALCHKQLHRFGLRPIASYNHEGNWLRNHGVRATSQRGMCMNCHDQPYCSSCHNDAMPLTVRARRPDRADRMLIHPAGYIARHRYDASGDPASCLRCHGASSCQECHDRAGLLQPGSSPHPAGYADKTSAAFHGPQVQSRMFECAGCHDAGRESGCIQCHAVGGTAGRSPHPPGWKTDSRQVRKLTAAPCTYCHRAGK